MFSVKQIIPSSLRKRISSVLVGDPEVDPSSTQNKPDDGAVNDVGVLVEMVDTPSEATESSVSVEMAKVNWASTDAPTPRSLTNSSDDLLKEDCACHSRPAVDSAPLNGPTRPTSVGLGTAPPLTSNLLFSPGSMLAPEMEVARLQALLAAQDRLIQEKDSVIRNMQDQIIR